MTLPVALVPAALSAIRSLLQLNRKIGSIAAVARLDSDMPVFLPPVADNILRDDLNDRARMETAFSTDTPHRAALLARGLGAKFDEYLNDPNMTSGDRRGLFFRFLGVFYNIEDADSQPDTENDEITGLDRFLVQSASIGDGPVALQILRATADTLLDFLGENATVFLAKSQHRDVLATLLREFAAQTDLETDNPERIVKRLLGSVALVASDPAHQVSDKPLAVLLFASLGKVRHEMGDDFVARIVSRDGFDAVVSDWLTRVATDDVLVDLVASIKDLDDPKNGHTYDPSRPETLPAALQPIYGVLSETLKTVGGSLQTRTTLQDPDTFQNVFQAVLTGLSTHSDALLRDKLAADQLMAQVLHATLISFPGTGARHSGTLIAPVFDTMLTTLTRILPDLGQDAALSTVQVLIQDLSHHVASDPFQTALAAVTDKKGDAFANLLLAELVGVIGTRSDLLLDGQNAKVHAALGTLLQSAPKLLDTGMTRPAITALFGDIILNIFPEDTTEGGFAAEILPLILTHLDGLGGMRARLGPADIEHIITSYITHFHTNRPIWQTLFDANLLPSVLDALSAGLRGAPTPQRLPPQVVAHLLSALTTAVGKHGIDLTDIAVGRANPTEFLQTHLQNLTARALTRVYARLGRGGDASHLTPLAERTLDLLLTKTPLTDADIDAFLAEEIRLLNQG